jgi:hypothetical protein
LICEVFGTIEEEDKEQGSHLKSRSAANPSIPFVLSVHRSYWIGFQVLDDDEDGAEELEGFIMGDYVRRLSGSLQRKRVVPAVEERITTRRWKGGLDLRQPATKTLVGG